MTSEPFLSPNKRESSIRCFVCWKLTKKKEKLTSIRKDGLHKFKEQAVIWSQIQVPEEEVEHPYIEVLNRLDQYDTENDFEITVHSTCRINFRNRIKTAETRYGTVQPASPIDETDINTNTSCSNSPVKYPTRSRVENVKTLEKKCFICTEVRDSDDNPYNEGGLQRCTRDATAKKLSERKEMFLKHKKHRYFDAAKRLDISLSGASFDIFAADIFYHQSCYVKFVINSVVPPSEFDLEKIKSEDVLNLFNYKIRIKVLRDKEAFLLHELLKDIKYLSTEQDLETPTISHTSSLKRHLIKEFPDTIAFFPSGKYLIVHPVDVNPCTYSVATLHGCGLREGDLAKAFGRMIRRKLQDREASSNTWPLTPDELLLKMDTGPLPEIYNAIYYSMHDRGSMNKYGYAETSYIKATKIWSLASDWEGLVTKQKTPKQIILGMVLHRITGSKEAVNALHKSNHTISYNDIRLQNAAWARMVTTNRCHFPNFRKGVTTHSTLDNNDGRQETNTGAGTTHDTNKTIFQMPSLLEQNNLPLIGEIQHPLNLNDEENDWKAEPLEYHPGKRVEPPLLKDFEFDFNTEKLDECFKRDIAWSLCGCLDEDDLPLLGSWTPFNKVVSNKILEPIVQEFLPVTPHPPEFPVCKEYLDFLLDVIDELEIPFIYVHSDEMVYSKLCDIIWKNKEIYSKIILLMGGFHQLRVYQRILYKRYDCKGFKPWCIDAGVIASGSAIKAFEGGHYYRSMRMHKECFDSLAQYRIETLTEGLVNISDIMKEHIRIVRKDPSAENLMQLMQLQEFNTLISNIIQCDANSDGDMTVQYLKDVSILLSLVASVREINVERHLQAEQQLNFLSFAFDHQNYARYNTYQNAYLYHLKQTEQMSFQELEIKGMGGSLTGDAFSAIHGDLMTELFNRETKGTSGPFRSGFSTDIDAVNTWVNTIHIHAMLRKSLHKLLHMKTSSKHKEVTPRGKTLHHQHVRSLKAKLIGYNVDPFSNDKPKHIPTGNEINGKVVCDMLRAKTLGKEKYIEFVDSRLIKGTVSFFSPIKRNKLDTGIKVVKKTPKAVEVLKEDCQAFGVVISKCISLETAFSYPITSIPLSIATPDGDLRQSDKASLRNFLIEQSSAMKSIFPKKASWLVDGLAAVQTLKSKPTYGEWIRSLLKFMTPPYESEPILIGMINDNYRDLSAKSNTRKKRGEAQKTNIEGLEQHMPLGIKWNEFLRNSENKMQLIELIATYLQSDDGRKLIQMPYIITSGEKTHILQKNGDLLEECNHEEADTRLIQAAMELKTDVVVVAKDTDVLILLVWAHVFYDVKYNWYLKYDSEKYADIKVIRNFFGRDLCLSLPSFHALTGCDTTSFFFKAGKVKSFKKVVADETKLALIQSLGKERTLSENNIGEIKEFVRSVVYSGKPEESYIRTRVRLYQNLTRKSSMSIPPDPDSIAFAIKRAHFQAYEWLRCCQKHIVHLNFEDFGWKIEDNTVKPVWYIGKQMPLSSRQRNAVKDGNSSLADDESTEPPTKILKKAKRKHENTIDSNNKSIARKFSATTNSENDADCETENQSEVSDDYSSNDESDWEVSDFLSSDDSCDEWLP